MTPLFTRSSDSATPVGPVLPCRSGPVVTRLRTSRNQNRLNAPEISDVPNHERLKQHRSGHEGPDRLGRATPSRGYLPAPLDPPPAPDPPALPALPRLPDPALPAPPCADPIVLPAPVPPVAVPVPPVPIVLPAPIVSVRPAPEAPAPMPLVIRHAAADTAAAGALSHCSCHRRQRQRRRQSKQIASANHRIEPPTCAAQSYGRRQGGNAASSDSVQPPRYEGHVNTTTLHKM